MKNLVLVHGSWYGAWCWQRVAERLRADGHRVRSPDLPAHGDDGTAVGEATLDAYVDAVVRSLPKDAPATIVGHSMAGIVLSTLAERHPERVERLVYVAAYLVADGETIFGHAMADGDSALGPHLRPDEAHGVIAVADEGFAAALASGCIDADVALARSKARPDPLAPLATPVHVTAERFGRVPRAYIKTLADRAVSTSLQTRMLAATPTPTIELDSGHSPFLSHDAALTAAILRAVG